MVGIAPSPVPLPAPLLRLLQEGAPAILATTGADGWPHLVMTWAAARDPEFVRFGADQGSITLANLRREGKATLQIAGRDNLLCLIKGSAKVLKEHVEASPFPIAMVEMALTEVRDQSWPGVVVSPLAFQWTGPDALEAAAAERAILAEIRAWGP